MAGMSVHVRRVLVVDVMTNVLVDDALLSLRLLVVIETPVLVDSELILERLLDGALEALGL
jgi:hypothetical protein